MTPSKSLEQPVTVGIIDGTVDPVNLTVEQLNLAEEEIISTRWLAVHTGAKTHVLDELDCLLELVRVARRGKMN